MTGQCTCLYMSFCFDIQNNVSLSVCLYVSLSVCLCLSLSVCHSLYLSLFLSLCLSLCVSLSLSVCLSVRLSLSFSVSVSQIATHTHARVHIDSYEFVRVPQLQEKVAIKSIINNLIVSYSYIAIKYII